MFCARTNLQTIEAIRGAEHENSRKETATKLDGSTQSLYRTEINHSYRSAKTERFPSLHFSGDRMSARAIGLAGLVLLLGLVGARPVGADPDPENPPAVDFTELRKHRDARSARENEEDEQLLLTLHKLIFAPNTPADAKVKALDVAASLARQGDAAPRLRGDLRLLLKDPNPEVRVAAAKAATAVHSWQAIPDLMRLLKDDDATVRVEAAVGLGNVKKYRQNAVPALIDALQDKDLEVVRAVLETLGNYGPVAHSAIPALIRKVKDDMKLKDIKQSSRAIYTLAGIGPVGPDGPKAVAFLLETLKAPDPVWRSSAATALGRMQPEPTEAIPALLALYNAKDVKGREPLKDLQWSVIGALAGMGPAGARSNPKVVPFLIQVLAEAEDYDLREAAAGALMAIGPDAKAAVPALKTLVNRRPFPEENAADLLPLQDIARLALPFIEQK